MARGICPVCDREFDRTRAGDVRFHYQQGRRCPGAGLQPVSLAPDPIAAAEQRGRQWAIDALRNRYSLGWDAWCVGKRRYLGDVNDAADWLEAFAKEHA